MNELTAINKVSSGLGISSRTLRYWESAGLFNSVRDVDSGWRLYDKDALQCIRITELLRRLDFSINDIRDVMEKRDIDTVCSVLNKQLTKLDKTGSDIEIRKEAISELIAILKFESTLTLSSLENLLLPVALERKKHIISKFEGEFSMESVKSKYDEVKIIRIAPMRTAAFSCIGTEPEDEAFRKVKDWVVKNGLEGTMRIFGFNTEPYPTAENPAYGFGFCATVPEGINIPEPLYEMRLPGGLYAVISQYEGDPSYGWKKVHALCSDKEWEWQYDIARNPGLEEHIEKATGGFLIPILFPVKKK